MKALFTILAILICASVFALQHIPASAANDAQQVPSKQHVVGDWDNDGVEDSADRCPDTPAGVTVDANGCPVTEEGEPDRDADGVRDSQDQCPNTPYGTPVGPNGCPL